MRRFCLSGLTLLLLCGSITLSARAQYPRIANLWGVSPTARDYDRLARYGLLVMGGGSSEAWRAFRREMQARSSRVLLLGTAPLMNLGAPADTPWMQDDWFLRRPDGRKIVWWTDQVYTPNLLNDDCLKALVDRTDHDYGALLREGVLDGVFYDSVVGRATWLGDVDTDRDGKADAPAEVDPRWHARQNLFFDTLRGRWPGIHILANDVDAEHGPHVNGRLFEGAPLLDQVANGSLTPNEAINTLNAWMRDSAQPGITFAIMTHPLGWQGWRVGRGDRVSTPGEVNRVRRDFARMRLGLLTTLMTDAYFAYDFGTVWYGARLWYAEYDAPLGRPHGPGREVFGVPPVTLLDWKAGQPPRGLKLETPSRVTPQGIEGRVEGTDAPWCRLFATDPRIIRLEPGRCYRIEAECEVLRQPTGTFQFNVRTAEGGWQEHDKGVTPYAGKTGSRWKIETTVIPDNYADYAAEWHLLGAGALRLRSLRVRLMNESYYRRDFDGGTALLNSTPHAIIIPLDRPMRRLKDSAAPRHVVETDDGAKGFTAEGAWEQRGGEGHFAGAGYRLAAKPGAMARWKFTAPQEDTYTLFAAIPGGRELTDAAAYTLRGGTGRAPTAVIDQRRCDGGWVRLFQVRLRAGQACEVALRSGGTGATAADAIRAESAARYNDGAVVRRVRLAPWDGMILLNR